MKKLFLLSGLIAFLTYSCNDAAFDRYPGTKLDSIPETFRGTYKDPDTKAKVQNYIIVDKNYWKESTKEIKYYLSDSMVFSGYKDAYYISSYEATKKYWQIMFIKQKGKDLYLYPMLYDTKIPKEKNSISKYFEPQVRKDSSVYFIMDNEKMYKYSQKELLQEEPMKLKRVGLKR